MIMVNQEIIVQADQTAIWDFLVDVDQVAKCFPGAEGLEDLGGDIYRVSISIKVGPIKPRVGARVAILSMDPPRRMKVSLDGKDRLTGSKIRADGLVTLETLDEGSVRVLIEGQVDVLGSLSKFGQPIADKKAQAIALQFTKAMQEKLSSSGS